MGWVDIEMNHHPAQAVGSHSSGPLAAKFELVNPTFYPNRWVTLYSRPDDVLSRVDHLVA